MKKAVLFLIAVVLVVFLIGCSKELAANKKERAIEAADISAASACSSTTASPNLIFIVPDQITIQIQTQPVENESEDELYLFLPEVPLSLEEQASLQDACEEFNVPYAMALAIIERETNFRNVIGDGGDSAGYMQVQKKWHEDRMNELGVTDLTDPEGNFRVGLNFVSELHDTYGTWETAVTVYNYGHNPGFVTDYAKAVLKNYDRWQLIITATKEEKDYGQR